MKINWTRVAQVKGRKYNPEFQGEREAQDFWKEFKQKENQGIGFAPERKMEALIKLSEIVIQRPAHIEIVPIADRRAAFNRGRMLIHPFEKYPLCFVCGGMATVRHHIITLQNGGTNNRRNVVSLCAPCHALIHPWLDEDQNEEERP